MGIALTALLLAFVIITQIPKYVETTSAIYKHDTVSYDNKAYCPDEVINLSFDIELRKNGPVEISSYWCKDNNACSPLATLVDKSVVFRQGEEIKATIPLTIPRLSGMTPNSKWVYVRAVRNAGSSQYDMFTVPFSIANDCK